MGENSKRNMEDYGYYSEFPKRLRALMENQNEISPLKRTVTQAELARHLGITRQAVSAYTLGTSVPDMLKFKAIADFFHVTYSYLLGASNVLVEGHKKFVDIARLPPSAVSAILRICSTDDQRIAFSFLVETMEFYDVINSIVANFMLIGSLGKQTDPDTLAALNKRIKEETDGALCVTSVRLEHDRNIFNAQRHLAKALEAIDTKLEDALKEIVEAEKNKQ